MLNPTHFQAKEEKVKAADDSFSEAYPLSEMHPFSETSCPLSGWETLEEEKSEICALSTQPARPTRMLFLLALSAPTLVKRKFTNSRLASHARYASLQKFNSPRAFKTLRLTEFWKRETSLEQQRDLSSRKERDLGFRGWRRHPPPSSSNLFHQR